MGRQGMANTTKALEPSAATMTPSVNALNKATSPAMTRKAKPDWAK